MHELQVDFETYISLLQQRGALTLLDENGAPVLSAVCTAAGERHTVFEVPEGITLDDASADNLGRALLSFTY